MSDHTPFNLFKYSLVLTSALAVIGVSSAAEAFNRRATQPSIEVHLEILQSLRQQSAYVQRSAPMQQPMTQQPMSAQQPVQQAMPFGRPSKPLQAAPEQSQQYARPVTQPPAHIAPQQPTQQPIVQAAPQTVNGQMAAQFEPSGAPTVAPLRNAPARLPVVAAPPATQAEPEIAPAKPAQDYATYQPFGMDVEPTAPVKPQVVEKPATRRPEKNPVVAPAKPAEPEMKVASKAEPKPETAVAPKPKKDAPKPEKKKAEAVVAKPEKIAPAKPDTQVPILLDEDAAPFPWESEPLTTETDADTAIDMVQPAQETPAKAPETALIELPKEPKLSEPEKPALPEPQPLPKKTKVEKATTELEIPDFSKAADTSPDSLALLPIPEPDKSQDIKLAPALAELPPMEDMDKDLPELAELPGLKELPAEKEPESKEAPSKLQLIDEPKEKPVEKADVKVENPLDAPQPLEALEPLPGLDSEQESADVEPQPAPVPETEKAPERMPAPPPPIAEPKKEEKKQGMFAGLTSKMASLLGADDKEEAPKQALPDLPPMPKATTSEPDIMPAEEVVTEEEEAEAQDSPSLPLADIRTARKNNQPDETGVAELPKLPPLPTEEVDEVPVATSPNRSLPSLSAIVTEDRRSELNKAETEREKAAEKAAAAKAEAKAAAEKEAAKVASAAADMKLNEKSASKEETKVELSTLEELPQLSLTPAETKPEENKAEIIEPLQPAEEMQIAALPKEEAAPSTADAVKEAKAPEVGYDNYNRKQVRLFYTRDDMEVQSKMHDALDNLVGELKEKPNAKLKIEAFAGTGLDDKTTSNRVSLRRALALRAYFIEAGIDTNRVNVQSMGNKSTGGPAERVDITLE
jgi:outer membrane protein OmpA-like peptidoglycan-associated protein